MDKEDLVNICNGILLSHKKNDMMTFATTWVDQEIIILTERGQEEKDRCHVRSLICGVSSMTQMHLPLEQKQTHRRGEQTCGSQGEGAEGGVE